MLPIKFFESPMSFESELVKIANQIDSLKASCKEDHSIMATIKRLEADLNTKVRSIYDNLTPIQKVEISRHPNRPHGIHYIDSLFDEFFELSGDRLFGEDRAIITGIANFSGKKIMVIAHEQGHNAESRKLHNFGMPLPEGYRKAIRCMEIAAELHIPILCLIDTPGAYPGITSEERGQGHALADCIATGIKVKVPIIACLIGQGGSGGAIAIGVANHVIMLEHSVYSVISPEGCASILWKTKEHRADAAVAQKLTAQDLYKYRLIDEILPEPFGGAHRDHASMIGTVKAALGSALDRYSNRDMYSIYLHERVEKYLNSSSLN